jgi:hypothetical protein
MKSIFFKIFLGIFFALTLPFAQAIAGATPCPPNCNQPSSSTNNANNRIISQIYGLLAQQSDINNQISQYPLGAPPQLIQKAQDIQAQINQLSVQVSGNPSIPGMAQLDASLNQMSAQPSVNTIQQYQHIQQQINNIGTQSGFSSSDSPAIRQAYDLLNQLQAINNEMDRYPQGAPPELAQRAQQIETQINQLGNQANNTGGSNPDLARLYSLISQSTAVNQQIAQYTDGPAPPALMQQGQNLQSQINDLGNSISVNARLPASNPVVTQIYALLDQQAAVQNQIAHYPGPGMPPVTLTQQSLAIQQKIQSLAMQVP